MTFQELEQFERGTMLLPPYSMNIVSSDFHLFHKKILTKINMNEGEYILEKNPAILFINGVKATGVY